MGKANVETNEVAVEETVKKKRPSRAREKKTGQEIVDQVGAITHELAQLHTALEEVDPSSILRPIAQDLVNKKQEELDNLLKTVFTV